MTPRQRYRADLERGGFDYDAAQAAAVERLQQLYEQLSSTVAPRHGLLRRLVARGHSRVSPEFRGIYLWGDVGRGKTHLVNSFYNCVTRGDKRRLHFHRLMQSVHSERRRLERERDPLTVIAARLADSCRLLCIDEFHVADIGDAMILAGLLRALFQRGVTLVATSNVPPDDLYRGGLQREQFLPAIDLIKRHMAVVELAGAVDHRLRRLDRAPVYYHPLDDAAELGLSRCFEALAPDARANGASTIEILGRQIDVRRLASGVAWFDFHALCDGPRSTADYIELARCYHTVLLSAVPRLGVDHADQTRRLIELVDEFYDRNVNLVVSAEAPPRELYVGERLRDTFARTVSRLEEMQSHDYLARPHRP